MKTAMPNAAPLGLFPNGCRSSPSGQALKNLGDDVELIRTTGRKGVFHREKLMGLRKNHGFSLLEMIITISISFIIAGITYMTLAPFINQGHINDAYDTTLMALRNTRNLAISQSHEYYVNFNPAGFPAGTIQVQYQGPAVGGIAPPLQQVITYSIPPDISYQKQAGFPASTPDAPLGAAGTAIDFESTPGVPLNYVVFYPDGSSQDSLGNYNSGIVYITQPAGSLITSRAITVWGPTGRIRGWRLNSVAGVYTWVQQ
jgi:prepilin-type N-terminal cleavage/methylation domain-containing protein